MLAFWTLTVPRDGSLELKIASALRDAPMTELPRAPLFLSLSFFFILCTSKEIPPHSYYLSPGEHVRQCDSLTLAEILRKTFMIDVFHSSVL